MITIDPPLWQRALYMVLFAINAYILLWFIFFLALVQFLLAFINDTENEVIYKYDFGDSPIVELMKNGFKPTIK